MPYRRRSRRTRRNFRRPKKAASKSYVKAVVRSAQRKDLHYLDNSQSSVSIGNSATPWQHELNFIAQGDTQTTRNGKLAQICSIAFRSDFYRNPSSTTHDRVRLLLCLVKRTLATPITAADVLQTTGSVQGDITAFRRINAGAAPNIKVLKDWTIDLGYTGSSKVTRCIKYYRKLKYPLRCWYDGSLAAYPEINRLCLLAFSDTSTNAPVVDITSRVTFIP